MIDDDGDELEDWELDEIRIEREAREALVSAERNHVPAVDRNPDWKGFTVPEWLRINTTDDRKRYK